MAKIKSVSKKSRSADQPELRLGGNASERQTSMLSREWKLVLEQRNLMYMLAAGLVMSPKGLAGKYYRDSLAVCPGWIPLFRGAIPPSALELAKSEGKSSRPVVATIDLNKVRGCLHASSLSGGLREIQFPKGCKEEDVLVLIPAPLPVTWITSLEFQSEDDREFWQTSMAAYDNVADYKLELNLADQLEKNKFSHWPVDAAALQNMDRSPDLSLAFGGCLGALFHMMEKSKEGMHIARYAFGDEVEFPEGVDLLFKPLTKAHFTNCGADGISEYFWRPVQDLVKVRSSTTGRSYLDTLLECLEGLAGEANDKNSKGLKKLADELRDVSGFSDRSISKIFERHPKRITRAMLLFALRGSVNELLEFEYAGLSSEDYLAAAILFGVRDGWIGLSKELKISPGLSPIVCHLMAAMEHEHVESGISLGEPPNREPNLWEMMVIEPVPWRAPIQKIAVNLANRKKWFDCIETTIKLKPGDYQLSSTQTNLVFKFQGKADVQEKLKESTFIEKIQLSSLSNKDSETLKKVFEKTIS